MTVKPCQWVRLPGLIEVHIFIKLARKRRGVTMINFFQNVIKHKVGLLNLPAELGNVPPPAR